MVTQKYNKLAGKHVLVIGGTSGKRTEIIFVRHELKNHALFAIFLQRDGN